MNTKLILIITLVITICKFGNSQSIKHFAIKFKDKDHSNYHLSEPEKFLSSKSLERRKRQGISIKYEDLPVSTFYINELKSLSNQVLYTSKWMNTAVIICNEELISQIQRLPYVDQVDYIGNFSNYEFTITEKPKKKKNKIKLPTHYYGQAFNQIKMLKGDWLHEQGYRGEGILVAVLDAGFWMADQLKVLEHFNERSGRVGHYDFIGFDQSVFETSDHGTKVLSVMAANRPGIMVGTAPHANYLCLKTEDIRGEYRLDEYNWLVGLEYADSIGVDVVVSGLGYTLFDDPDMNYSFEDLQSHKALSTQAAEMAFQRGMIVVCSAGNEGKLDWKYVSCPADAATSLAVGAINEKGERPGFSSIPFNFKEGVKPDLEALGEKVVVATTKGKSFVERVSGSSYSAPLIGGLVASLWSAFRYSENYEIIDAVRKSIGIDYATYSDVKNRMPDFKKAYYILSEKQELSTYDSEMDGK